MPSTQRMDEEGRGKGMGKPRFKIYFFMTSALRLATILDGPKSGHYYPAVQKLRLMPSAQRMDEEGRGKGMGETPL